MAPAPKKATLQQLERKLLKLPNFSTLSLHKRINDRGRLEVTSIFIHWDNKSCSYFQDTDCIEKALEALEALNAPSS